jgi:hypothetical protein
MGLFMTGGELARSLGPLAAVGAVSLLCLEGFYPVMLVGILASLWLFLRFKDIFYKKWQKQYFEFAVSVRVIFQGGDFEWVDRFIVEADIMLTCCNSRTVDIRHLTIRIAVVQVFEM